MTSEKQWNISNNNKSNTMLKIYKILWPSKQGGACVLETAIYQQSIKFNEDST